MTHGGGVHMQNAHQSVIAQTFTNEQSLNFSMFGHAFYHISLS
jgi:hypothetical protein